MFNIKFYNLRLSIQKVQFTKHYTVTNYENQLKGWKKQFFFLIILYKNVFCKVPVHFFL